MHSSHYTLIGTQLFLYFCHFPTYSSSKIFSFSCVHNTHDIRITSRVGWIVYYVARLSLSWHVAGCSLIMHLNVDSRQYIFTMPFHVFQRALRSFCVPLPNEQCRFSYSEVQNEMSAMQAVPVWKKKRTENISRNARLGLLWILLITIHKLNATCSQYCTYSKFLEFLNELDICLGSVMSSNMHIN